ncbi:hypothetical protein FHX81_4271 [Saccharothrix saharensis]|uniref:Uncharacterized protein n=1 Tax=Saccharothrix saharensis TaxID=571190 RepID=A0A543JGC4_9PSEU|nr:hypothetical protein [Saccharothrix saharensis]TQM81885.1 hypothetical protein FHX81_4271 [Saccharothrix saharensis]
MSEQHVGPPHGPSSTTAVARAIGIVMVAYSFLWGLWPDVHGELFDPVVEVREWFNRPVGLGEDFGPLGVMLLLLVSGYLGTSRDADVVHRLVRVYVPLVAGAVLAAALIALHVEVLPNRTGAVPVPTDVLWDLTLVAHLAPGAPAVLALGWVLTVELITVVTGALTKLHRHACWLVPAAQLAVVAALVPFTEGLWLSFLPVAVIGQLMGSRGRVPNAVVPGALGIAAWVIVAWAETRSDLVNGWWYPLAACYAVLLFALLLRVGTTHRAVLWLATRARWLLAATGTVGWAVLHVSAAAPFAVSAALATAATAGAAEAAHRVGTARALARVPA